MTKIACAFVQTMFYANFVLLLKAELGPQDNFRDHVTMSSGQKCVACGVVAKHILMLRAYNV